MMRLRRARDVSQPASGRGGEGLADAFVRCHGCLPCLGYDAVVRTCVVVGMCASPHSQFPAKCSSQRPPFGRRWRARPRALFRARPPPDPWRVAARRGRSSSASLASRSGSPGTRTAPCRCPASSCRRVCFPYPCGPNRSHGGGEGRRCSVRAVAPRGVRGVAPIVGVGCGVVRRRFGCGVVLAPGRGVRCLWWLPRVLA